MVCLWARCCKTRRCSSASSRIPHPKTKSASCLRRMTLVGFSVVLFNAEVRQIRMMREKETNKFRGMCVCVICHKGMAFVDIPDGSVCKALNLHRTYFNGRQINVEETKDGGKHSAVRLPVVHSNYRKRRTLSTACESCTTRGISRRTFYFCLFRDQQHKYILQYLKSKHSKLAWEVGLKTR